VRRVFAGEISDGSLKSLQLSDGRSLADALLEPHRCYLPSLRALLENPALHALAHITGGGLEENTSRVIPPPLRLEINWRSWERPEIFRLIQEKGGVPEAEMRRVLNLGIGVVAVVERAHADEIAGELRARGEQVTLIGRVTA